MAYTVKYKYQAPLSNAFMLDCMISLLKYCVKDTKSSTLKSLGLETLTYWVYINQSTLPHFDNLGHYTRDSESINFIL